MSHQIYYFISLSVHWKHILIGSIDSTCFQITKIGITSFISNLISSLNVYDVPVRSIKCSNEAPSSDDTSAENDLLTKIADSLQTNPSFALIDTDVKFYLNMSVTTENAENPGELMQIGTVDEHQYIASSPQVIRPTKRFFRVGITEAIPWTYMKTHPQSGETMIDENGNPIWEGYCIDMIQRLSEDLEFDYELVVPKKGTFGKRIAFNKWDGLVGDLMTGVNVNLNFEIYWKNIMLCHLLFLRKRI